jgi:hypothetical protein
MPVPQGPRRAAPPRKKSSQKQTPPAETEATTVSLEKETPIHDISDIVAGSQTTPIPVPGYDESEVDASADPNAIAHLTEPADENLEPTEPSFSTTAQLILDNDAGSGPAPPPIPLSPPLDLHSESPGELEADSKPTQGLQSHGDIGELADPSIPTASQQEETETEGVVVPGPDDHDTPVAPAEEDDEDETARKQRIAEHVAKMGGFNPFGGHPMRPPTPGDEPPSIERKASVGAMPVEGEGTTLQGQPPPPNPYSVFQQGGRATVVNEEGDNDDDGNDGKY